MDDNPQNVAQQAKIEQTPEQRGQVKLDGSVTTEAAPAPLSNVQATNSSFIQANSKPVSNDLLSAAFGGPNLNTLKESQNYQPTAVPEAIQKAFSGSSDNQIPSPNKKPI